MKLTIIIPTYNEESTIQKVLTEIAKTDIGKIKKEIIVINDGSTDSTLKKIKESKISQLKIINKNLNQGKGSAIKSALKISTGDINIIQDADLEYSPSEYLSLLEPILQKKADVVFGSRFVTGKPRRVFYFWHYVANLSLTLLSNIITNLNLSDMETCYKVFTKEVAQNLNLVETRFGFEPEFTIKVARAKWIIYEIGISYSGRGYSEGKKIKWTDGVQTLWCLIKYGLGR